jgi:hypothetical protein
LLPARPTPNEYVPGITPGDGKLIGCLKEHKDEVSIGCAKTLKGIKEKMGK